MTPAAGTAPAITWRHVALLIALAAMWGASFLFIKIAVETVPPLTVVAGRLVVASLLLLVVLRLRGLHLPLTPRAWRPFLVIGLVGNVLPFTLIGWGEMRIDSGLAAILIGTMPLFTVLLAHLFTGDERLTRMKLAGVTLGLGGLVVLVGPQALAGLGGHMAGEIAVTFAAMSYAAAAIYSRRLARVAPAVTATGSIIAAAAIAVPASLVVDAPWSLSPTPGAFAAILALAVFSTALGALVFFKLLGSAGATFAALSNYLIPLTGVALGVIFLGEQPAPSALLAMAMILASIALVKRAGAPAPAGPAGERA